MSDELKKCPFCGGEKIHTVYCNEAFGVCDSCGARGKSCPGEYGRIAESIDREWAVKAWNTRPLEAALQERIDELRDKSEKYIQAFGYLTVLHPTMVMASFDPMDMAKEIYQYVTQRIIDLESENKALKLIANSHSMSELRRNRIMAGDKLIKCPPAPESEAKQSDYSIKPEFMDDTELDDIAMVKGGTDGE